MPEPSTAKDLILLLSLLVSCGMTISLGLIWYHGREINKKVKQLQEEWADRNETRRREIEETDDDWVSRTWRPTNKN